MRGGGGGWLEEVGAEGGLVRGQVVGAFGTPGVWNWYNGQWLVLNSIAFLSRQGMCCFLCYFKARMRVGFQCFFPRTEASFRPGMQGGLGREEMSVLVLLLTEEPQTLQLGTQGL